MNKILRFFWPPTLAGRLTLFLVLALAVAQAGLALLLNSQRDQLVSSLTHNQSLNQTVTLARLLDNATPAEVDSLVAAFGSRQSCAWLRTSAPAMRTMTDSEEDLAQVLAGMLHGVRAGEPLVTIETSPPRELCADLRPAAPAHDNELTRDHDDDNDGAGDDDFRVAALTTDVPLTGGRWLSVRTRVEVPGDFDRTTLITFLLSSLAVAVVGTLVVRWQTRSLRTLADASERLGRGETVQALPAVGPAEVNAATSAFNTMQHRLGEFLRDRMRLLASISHDLRTPITTLRLKAELIEDEAARDDLVKTIDELATICEETLAFTRAEATTEDTKVVDLATLVREVTQEFVRAGKPAEEMNMTSIRCACRPVALKRALRNLIENAVRYGHRARITVLADEGHALIRVEDEGSGIPTDKIDDAFQPFVRLETSRNNETGGIGLGLAIARSIVAAHGGTITLSNGSAGGLRAEIALPLTE